MYGSSGLVGTRQGVQARRDALGSMLGPLPHLERADDSLEPAAVHTN